MNENLVGFITGKIALTCLVAVLAFLVLLPYSLNEWAEYQRTQLRLEAERAYFSDRDPDHRIVWLLHGGR
jgi:hypothetical protein